MLLVSKCYYQSGPDWCKSLLPVRARNGTSLGPDWYQFGSMAATLGGVYIGSPSAANVHASH